MKEIAFGIFLPWLGTTLGAACVFFMGGTMHRSLQRGLTGFAAGVMVAASIWSLLIPAMEQSEQMGVWAFVPAAVGFWLGILFLLLLDRLIPHLHANSKKAEGPKSSLSRSTMMVLAVTLHNLPEGMAVGVVFAGWAMGNAELSLAGALTLSLGIAIQNVPEGAIIAMPLRAAGNSRLKAFGVGTASGVAEPLGAILVIALASVLTPLMPYLLAFAAGAMLYVVVEELIPETAEGAHSNLGTIGFALGFALMMVLDVVLG